MVTHWAHSEYWSDWVEADWSDWVEAGHTGHFVGSVELRLINGNLRVVVFEFLSSLDSFVSSRQAPDDSGDINRPLQSKNDMAWMAPFNLNIVPGMKSEKMSHLMTKPTEWLCAHQRLRSARLGAQSLCWFCHVVAQIGIYTWATAQQNQ